MNPDSHLPSARPSPAAHDQVVVWIDHREARLVRLMPSGAHETTVTAPVRSTPHKHPHGPEGGKEHPEDAKRFFHEVAQALVGAEAVLVVGPSTAKLELLRYVHRHEHALEAKVVGVETVDHPTDRQLVAYAKSYFETPGRGGVTEQA